MRWALRIKHDPRQMIFRPDRDLGRIVFWLVERTDRHIEPFAASVIFKKKRRAAATGERTNSIRMINLPHFAEKNLDLVAPKRSPGHERRSTRAPAINAMAIAHLPRRIMQSVAHATAETAAIDLRIHLLVAGGVDPGRARY